MKDKGLLVIVGFLLWQMAFGLEMCKGPFKPPSIDDVTALPNGPEPGKKSVLAGVDTMVKMTSSVPLTANWMSIRSQTRTEDNPRFNTSTEVNGNSYIFTAKDRLAGHFDTTNIARLTQHTYIKVTAHYPGCNSVRYTFQVADLLEMAKRSTALPTIEEMPAKRYNLNEGESVHDMATRLILSGGGNGAMNASLHCENLYSRVNDSLVPEYILRPSAKSLTYNAMKTAAGVAVRTCIVEKMGYNVKSKIFGLQAQVDLSPSVRFRVLLTTEICKPDISKPAIRVESEPFGNTLWMNRMEAVPATENTTRFTCLTDAETVQNVTLVESIYSRNGTEKRRLAPAFSHTDPVADSIHYFVYDVTSPGRRYFRKYYECTVVDGDGRQNSMKFIVGPTPTELNVEPKTIHLSRLNDSTENSLRVRFDAIGSPQVEIKLYAGIQPFSYPLDEWKFQGSFDKSRQINGSEEHRLTFRKLGAKVQGRLVVPDVRKLVPCGYWDESDSCIYYIVCFAHRRGWPGAELKTLVIIHRY